MVAADGKEIRKDIVTVLLRVSLQNATEMCGILFGTWLVPKANFLATQMLAVGKS